MIVRKTHDVIVLDVTMSNSEFILLLQNATVLVLLTDGALKNGRFLLRPPPYHLAQGPREYLGIPKGKRMACAKTYIFIWENTLFEKV